MCSLAMLINTIENIRQQNLYIYYELIFKI